MYFNHAFRKTLLGAETSTAPLENTFTAVGGGIATPGFAIGTGTNVGIVTYTTTSVHGLAVGDTVTILGIVTGTSASIGSPNGFFVVSSVPSTTTFTVVNSLQTAIWSSGGTVNKGVKTTSTLTAGQIGLFNKNFAAINPAQQATSEPFYLIQGSYYKNSGYSDKIGSHGGYQESVKSKMINPKYINRIFIIQAKAPVQQVVQIPLTAQAGSTNVGLNADTTYRLRIDVKGSPALRFLSHNIYRVMDSYTGPLNATNPTYVKDPVATLVDFKEQLTMSPYFNQLVQARAYVLKVTNTTTSANATSTTTTQATFVPSTFTSIYVGQRVIGTGIPANSFVTIVTGTTSITITYPTQATAPAVAVFNALSIKYYNDVYGVNGGYTIPYTNIAVTSGQQPTYVGQTPYIPGTTTSTGATIVAASTLTAATSGAHVYTAASDAASFTQSAVGVDAFLELTAAYAETKFGNPTFTISDNYDLEPLKIIASLMDDSGSTTVVAPIGTAAAQTIGEAGIATVAQPSSMAQGTGETVLRELILTGRYRQEAFGDGTNIDQFRMREIEANPGVMDMMTVTNRNSLYHRVCILHSVPRFNNPTAVFDNDQYLIEVAFPNTVTIANLLTANSFSSYIVEAAQAAQGTTAIQLEII